MPFCHTCGGGKCLSNITFNRKEVLQNRAIKFAIACLVTSSHPQQCVSIDKHVYTQINVYIYILYIGM